MVGPRWYRVGRAGDDHGPHHRDGECRDGHQDVPLGPCKPLLEQRGAEDHGDHGAGDGARGNRRRELARGEAELLEHDPQHGEDADEVGLGIGEHRGQAGVELGQHRFGHHGEQTRRGARHGAVGRRLDRQAAVLAHDEDGPAQPAHHDRRDQPRGTGRVRAPVGRVTDAREGGQPCDDDDRGNDLATRHALFGQPDAERQHEYQAHRQKHLHDRDPAAVERQGLEQPADEHHPERHQPYGALDQLQERARVADRHVRHLVGAALLHHGRERERECRQECENFSDVRTLGWRVVGPRSVRAREPSGGKPSRSGSRTLYPGSPPAPGGIPGDAYAAAPWGATRR